MLFDKIKIGRMTLENRFVMAPMETNFARDDGSASQRHVDHYARRARGGPRDWLWLGALQWTRITSTATR